MSEETTLDEFGDETPEENSRSNEWRGYSLSTLADLSGGKTPKRSEGTFWGGETCWVSPKDFDGLRISDTEDKLTEEGINETNTSVYDIGTTVIVTRSGVLRHSLPVAILDIPAAINQDLKALVPDTDIVRPEFFIQAIAGHAHDIRGSCIKTGTTVESIQTNVLKQYQLSIPPLPEQRKIATVLHAVDRVIEKTEEIIEQTERVRRGTAQDLFREGTSQKETKETWLGEIPEDWKIVQFSEIVNSNRNGLYKPKDAYGGEFPIAKMGNALENRVLDMSTADRLELTGEEIDKYGLNRGDLIFARRAQEVSAAGDCCYVPKLDETTVFESSLIRVRLSEDVDPRFYVQYFNSPVGSRSIKRIVTETSISGIATSDLLDLKVAVPNFIEQQEIADIMWQFDEQYEALQREKKQYERFKRGLMRDLLSGEVRTTDKSIEVPDEISQHG
jgi:type I restriction enzyme S subunit